MPFEPKSSQTRQWIIETTAELFNKKGYAGTSISDLTTATGMTKGAIYGNFENKEDIAIAAFEYNLQARINIIRQELEKATSYRDKLLVYANVFRPSRKFPFPGGGCPMQNTGIEADDTHELLREKAAQALEQWRRMLENLVNKGIAAGEFRPGTPARRIATSIIALAEGGILLQGVSRKAKDLELALDTVEEIINGISV
ncbi:TetR/AcrR family transcriptional regulator [Chitinophaga japonensis]|uniref:TetR family transcriptional regulator n=1 Tax=Chitinophaga japonensis TaxID=104662 RepID=A0A562SHZ5_CHIJA|nr:TetR/AcrR family transcriptional regulator [Chitinophaga japonensis]TWI80915.1 TetR family transcriptional regulator [Chitinophaga japonensis]